MNLKQMFKVGEAASELGLSQACLRAWIASRRIEIVRLGRAVRISRQEIERIIGAGTVRARERGNRR